MKLTNKWRCEKLGVTVEAGGATGEILNVFDLDRDTDGDWFYCTQWTENKRIYIDKDRYRKTENIEESVFEFVRVLEPENIDEFVSDLKLKLKRNKLGYTGYCSIQSEVVSCLIRDCNLKLLMCLEVITDLNFEIQKKAITDFFKVFDLLEE